MDDIDESDDGGMVENAGDGDAGCREDGGSETCFPFWGIRIVDFFIGDGETEEGFIVFNSD